MNLARAFAAVIVSFTPAQGFAQDVSIASADGGERVILTLPNGWHEAASSQARAGTSHTMLREFLPDGQSTDNWNAIISVLTTTYDDAPNEDDFETAAKAITVRFYADLCEGKPDRMGVYRVPKNGYGTAIFNAGCSLRPEAKANAKPGIYLRDVEFLTGVVIQGEKTIYVVQHAWHSDLLKSDGKGGLTGPESELAAMQTAGEEAAKLSFEGVWPCNDARPDRPCTKP